MNTIKTSIVLQQLELNLSLGWPDYERSQAQSVMLDIYMDFLEPHESCITDQLDEKTNYDALNQKIVEKMAKRSFRLIEHLGHELYQLIKAFLPENTLVTVCITKKPPIANLKGGVQFWYGDNIRV